MDKKQEFADNIAIRLLDLFTDILKKYRGSDTQKFNGLRDLVFRAINILESDYKKNTKGKK